MNTGNSSQSLLEEIDRFLPDATEDQVERFAVQVERLNQLEDFFKKYPEDLERCKDQLARAQKALNYKQPYRIAVIGTIGAGKSTMLNALLGRELVLTKIIGKPATGAALEIVFDVAEDEPEKALVNYRNEANIRHLLNNEFIKQYKLNDAGLNGKLDIGFAGGIKRLEPSQKLREQDRNEFEQLRNTIADIVVQYANNGKKNLRTDFSLENNGDVRELMALTDENSSLNGENSPERRIGLVKSVVYHVKQAGSAVGMPTLQLPKNVRLVDLPGLDGSPLHDIIIREGVEEADAVIFILRPPRILGRGDAYLLNRVRRYVGFEGNVQSGERIFLVLNAKDSITSDRIPDNVQRDMQDLMEELAKGYARDPYLANRGGDKPYFLTSALAALFAQKALKGEYIEDPDTYEATKVNLGVKNGSDREVLEASQVPHLVAELTKFARDRRIEGQISDGRLALDSIVNPLYREYEEELRSQRGNKGKYYLEQKVIKQLEERQKNLEKQIIKLRTEELGRLDKRQQQLEIQARSICDEADKKLQEKMPQLWKDNYTDGINRLVGKYIGNVLHEPVLTEAQICLWKQLNKQIPNLADQLVNAYREGLKAYKMVHKIAQECYGAVKVEQLEAEIEEWVTDMGNAMSGVSARLAMTRMTDPERYLVAVSDEQKPEKKQILDMLSKIPAQPDVEANRFSTLMVEIRKQYEPFVKVYCVKGLLNLYRYEMLEIEDKLLSRIRDEFHRIKNDDDPILRAKVRESLSDGDLERIERLERKLAALSSFKAGKQSWQGGAA